MHSQDATLLDIVHRLRQDPTFSDLTILIGAEKYKIHKSIVCPQSPWFKDEAEEESVDLIDLNHDYKGKVHRRRRPVSNHDSAAFPALLDFFYGRLDYKSYHGFIECAPLFLAKLYILAEEFEVVQLQDDVVATCADAVSDTSFSTKGTFAKVLEYVYSKSVYGAEISAFKAKMLDFALKNRHWVLIDPQMVTLLHEQQEIAVDMVLRLNNYPEFKRFFPRPTLDKPGDFVHTKPAQSIFETQPPNGKPIDVPRNKHNNVRGSSPNPTAFKFNACPRSKADNTSEGVTNVESKSGTKHGSA